MSRLNEAKALLSRLINEDIDGEINRSKQIVDKNAMARERKVRRLSENELSEISHHVATLLQIRGALQTASDMISRGEIRDARWQRARRRK